MNVSDSSPHFRSSMISMERPQGAGSGFACQMRRILHPVRTTTLTTRSALLPTRGPLQLLRVVVQMVAMLGIVCIKGMPRSRCQ